MSKKNESKAPEEGTDFVFDKFMEDLANREAAESERLREIQESDRTNPIRERSRLNREEWANRIRWHKKTK
jgi:hypothetical protein